MKYMVRTLMIVLGIIALAIGGLSFGIDVLYAPTSPEVTLPQELLDAEVTKSKTSIRHWDKCYAFSREDIAAGCLAGPPEIRGLAQGRLFPDAFYAAENASMKIISKSIPNKIWRWLCVRVLFFRQAKLAGYYPLDVQKEIYAFTQVTKNIIPVYGSYYNRLLQSQALYDVAHQLGVETGITGTAFGVLAEKTRDQAPLLAHNIDFARGQDLDQNKLVLLIRPETGYAYISVTWPGMFGVLSGMNEAGLGVAVLAAQSEDKAALGMPISIIARKVLTAAGTLQQAVSIIKDSPVMVSESFLVGSGSENKFVVVEKTPQRTGVRKPQNGFIIAANHFISSALYADPVNQARRQSGPSMARLRRLKELLNRQENPLQLEQVTEILRDRRGEFDVRLGSGHKSAINGLTAVHSVIFNLRRKQAWVAQSPHQLGQYVLFDLKDFSGEHGSATLEADTFLRSGKYNEYLVYQHGLREAQRFYREKKHRETLAWLQEVYLLNPLDYHSFLLAGKALRVLGRIDEAKYNYEQAKKLQPAFFREKVEVEKELEALQTAPGVAP